MRLNDLLLIDDMNPVDAERSTENKKYYKKFYTLQREGHTIGNVAIQQDKKSNCIAIHITDKVNKYWEQHCEE
jgi:N-acetylglutamate synthase-like GNAT family acetyltransferase